MVTTTSKNIILANCTLSIYKDNIVLMKVNKDAEINKESAQNITKNILTLANNQPFKVIVDTRNALGVFTSNARNHFATTPKYNEFRIKSAVIINSLSIRILVNFYRKIHLQKNDLKIVKDYKEALIFLST